ncbi:MAG: hypothetical protein LBJ67_12460 [Planctomycetaceae bacterium]|jgi:hypothetical protein|nr:hypothetical protein [Planctomycetaceae bacterium]
MGILNKFGKWFGRKKKPTLKRLPLEDLRREQLTVQNELRKLEIENDKNERDEFQLKEEYKAAHAAGRESLKRSVAQKLQNQQLRRKGLDSRLAYTNKMYQTVTGMLIIKENMAFFEKLGVGSIISDMDLGELENYVAEATIEGTLQQEKLVAMLQGVSDGVEQLNGVAQDGNINNFMAELDAELIHETPLKHTAKPQTVSQPVTQSTSPQPNELNDVLRTIDAVAAKGIDAARQMQHNTQSNVTPSHASEQEKQR